MAEGDGVAVGDALLLRGEGVAVGNPLLLVRGDGVAVVLLRGDGVVEGVVDPPPLQPAIAAPNTSANHAEELRMTFLIDHARNLPNAVFEACWSGRL